MTHDLFAQLVKTVNTFHMTHDLFAQLVILRSYSRAWCKHILYVITSFYYAKRSKQYNMRYKNVA